MMVTQVLGLDFSWMSVVTKNKFCHLNINHSESINDITYNNNYETSPKLDVCKRNKSVWFSCFAQNAKPLKLPWTLVIKYFVCFDIIAVGLWFGFIITLKNSNQFAISVSFIVDKMDRFNKMCIRTGAHLSYLKLAIILMIAAVIHILFVQNNPSQLEELHYLRVN